MSKQFTARKAESFHGDGGVTINIRWPYYRFWIQDVGRGDDCIQIRLEADHSTVFVSTNQPGKALKTKNVTVEEFIAKFRDAFFS